MQEPRPHNFIMRVSQTELDMLRALAEATGLSGAAVLRTCLRERYAKEFGSRKLDAKPAKRAKKKS